MHPAFIGLQTSTSFRGRAIPGADDRQTLIPGFDQEIFSASTVLFVGAGGLVSQIAPPLARKGVGRIKLFDNDIVEASNLNRQRFYREDIGSNKALALAKNLQHECISSTEIIAWSLRFEDAVARGIDMQCDVAVCGVDNNLARVAASRYFRAARIPVIFTAVSRDADHGYVFVQGRDGACIGCLFPDIVNDDRYPCPRTPAIADILQAVGSLVIYAVDTLLMQRPRSWNYRRIGLADGALDGVAMLSARQDCSMQVRHDCKS